MPHWKTSGRRTSCWSWPTTITTATVPCAVAEVHKAIRELEGKHHPKKVVSGTTPVPVPTPIIVKPAKPKQPAMREPQAASDAQLQEALQLLQASTTEINSKHPRAAANVAAAIRELNTALKIK